jgi:hypothetical protein
MNERIQKLKQQATTFHYSGHGEIAELDAEKFAELILTEVIGTIYRSDISDKKQERLVQELAHKFGFLGD